MPRRLSNIEWSTFLNEIHIEDLNLPPFGGVVEWRGMDVLVHTPRAMRDAPIGEVFLTDVTDIPEWQEANIQREYDSTQQVWFFRLPEQTAQVILERAGQLTSAVDFTFSNLGIILTVIVGVMLWRELQQT